MTKRLIASAILALALVAPAVARQQSHPELVAPGTDASWRRTAKERSERSIFLLLSEQAAMAIFLATLAFGGASARLRARVTARVGTRWLRDALFLGLVFLMVFAVSMPFDAARYALSRLYGVATQPFAGWIGDSMLAFCVQLALAVPLGVAFYRVVDRRPRTWWRWAAAGALPLAVAATLATPLYLSLFNAFEPLDDRRLAGRVLELAARSGIPAEEVYEYDLSRQTRAANAFVGGIGPTAIVALGDTLLDEFSDEEVLFVTAHEIGHYVGGHVWLALALGCLLSIAGAWALKQICRQALTRFHDRLDIDDLSDVASAPLFLLVAGALAVVAMPVANLVSRSYEASADRFALEATVPGLVSPEAAVSTFERLGRLGLSDPSPNPIVKYVLWSHPTLDERVAAVQAFAAR